MQKMALLLLGLAATLAAYGQGITDATLRVDYIFAGSNGSAQIFLDKMSCSEGWHGRKVNMSSLPLRGNGSIVMQDAETADTLYMMSFSTLFQEWMATPQAKTQAMSFQNSFLLPMPERKANVTVSLYNYKGAVICSYSHVVKADDILIRKAAVSEIPVRYIHKGGDTRTCIDVAIIAEGYTAEEQEKFYEDATVCVDAIFAHEPFASMKDRFNFLAVAAASPDSGVSIPRENIWKDTAVNSHFDTFYMERYLTTESIQKMHDLLDGLPYEHIIVLANTDTYGGGGIYNAYTLTTAHHPMFRPVVVHEFGHSFAGLGDEYDYDSGEDPYYRSDAEPWEQNITTCHDFASKWQDMMNEEGVELVEGAGYQKTGVWRPARDCRMRTNQAPAFCPVCQRAIRRIIEFNTIQAE